MIQQAYDNCHTSAVRGWQEMERQEEEMGQIWETKEKECADLRKELHESKQMYERLLEERADVMEKVLKEESEERERAMAAKEEECVKLRKELREIKQMYAQVIDGEQRTIASRDEVGANNIFRRFQRG